jgi:hypothetical protein
MDDSLLGRATAAFKARKNLARLSGRTSHDAAERLERPDTNLESMVEVVGVLLGLLFVVVIYFLENPSK